MSLKEEIEKAFTPMREQGYKIDTYKDLLIDTYHARDCYDKFIKDMSIPFDVYPPDYEPEPQEEWYEE